VIVADSNNHYNNGVWIGNRLKPVHQPKAFWPLFVDVKLETV